MGGHFATWYSPSEVFRGLHPNWMGVLLAIWPALVSFVFSADNGTPVSEAVSSSKSPAADSLFCAVVAGDVVLQNGGVLRGMVLAERSGLDKAMVASGVRVMLLFEGKVVAETVSDQAGRFTVSHLHGGKYVIAVDGNRGVDWSLYRVWTPAGAPPKTSAMAQIVVGRGTLRGQGPLPAVSFSEAALISGVVVGAVAAPAIYHNAQKSNRVPASP